MAKKYLGQYFLYDPTILKRIVEVARLSPDDTVIEIGPGPGRLTRMLAGGVKKVIAIELDEDLFARLSHDLSAYKNIELVLGNALKYGYEALKEFKVVANIPYYITTPILFRLLELRKRVRTITVMVQKEVAERIVAGPGDKTYGVLSIMVQYHAHAELVFQIPRGAFRPVPKVDSAVLHLEVLEQPFVEVIDEGLFFRVVKTTFSQRRKTLANSLKPLARDSKRILMNAGIDPLRRPETLSIEDFGRLSDFLKREEPAPKGGTLP